MVREIDFDEFKITSDSERVDFSVVLGYLKKSYWASEESAEKLTRSIQNSLCFSVFYKQQQIGFARIVTDYARFAYLADFFIIEEYRGNGLSKKLIEFILAYPGLKGCKYMLATKDAHQLYAKFGFTELQDPGKYMELSDKR
jgi:GNAT superfamily N-acetyltransferase